MFGHIFEFPEINKTGHLKLKLYVISIYKQTLYRIGGSMLLLLYHSPPESINLF